MESNYYYSSTLIAPNDDVVNNPWNDEVASVSNTVAMFPVDGLRSCRTA